MTVIMFYVIVYAGWEDEGGGLDDPSVGKTCTMGERGPIVQENDRMRV